MSNTGWVGYSLGLVIMLSHIVAFSLGGFLASVRAIRTSPHRPGCGYIAGKTPENWREIADGTEADNR